MSTDTISRLNREAMALHQSIQRLTRENHELSTRLSHRTAQCADAVCMAGTWQDKAEGEAIKYQAASDLYHAELQRRRAAPQALSASKIRWGTLALGWCLGAATVLIWAFWS